MTKSLLLFTAVIGSSSPASSPHMQIIGLRPPFSPPGPPIPVPSIPPPNYTGPTLTSPAIIVSDSALPYMSISTTSPNQITGVQVADPVVLDVPIGISSIMLADLNRKTNFIEYSLKMVVILCFTMSL